ncbi:hypothetical protein ColLi_06548 [Colletotrichum liriopes]|uniref:Uncharacterized protein n=1 Tax=Colletotrichum liriopes TaxID=708192 RepID=A0AA37LSF7_9PEZI|nr:hypothetical protein ColLi_06548 [Colletotrichum liriopes]
MDAIPQPSLPVARSPREHSATVESGKAFSLRDVLAIRKIHPFYTSDVMYPPNADAILVARERAAKETGEVDLKYQPLLWKKDLYTIIERLISDSSPQNTFRQSIYTSMTGGGSGSKPLFFATDVHENRRHRALFGRFLRNIGLATETDWVVTVHPTGGFIAGYHMPPAVVVRLITEYSANVLSGDSGQIVSMVHYISSLSQEKRAMFNINKVIYTSESLTIAQRAHIRAVLGLNTQICSILGSAEGGPYGASCAHLSRDLGSEDDDSAIEEFQDFIIDARITKIEILPTSVPENDTSPVLTSVQDGQRGMIAQTSLTRLRNPLVRYITGDIGSLHKLPQKVEVMLPEQERQHMYMLRLYGRDRRFSFEWGGEYYEFRNLIALMDDVWLGVLQWQVILEKSKGSEEALLEVRLLRSNGNMNGNLASKEELTKRIRIFFSLGAANEERFRLVFLDCYDEFELSASGRKVIKFVDRYH